MEIQGQSSEAIQRMGFHTFIFILEAVRAKAKKNKSRGDRSAMDMVVDAYDGGEQAMG